MRVNSPMKSRPSSKVARVGVHIVGLRCCVAWFPLGVFAEAVGGGERAARNSCWWQGARATTRLSFLVADTSSTASVHLDYSLPSCQTKTLHSVVTLFFLFRIRKQKTHRVCALAGFPSAFRISWKSSDITMVLDFVKILALVSLAGKTLNFW
jgi:hypothetical protein